MALVLGKAKLEGNAVRFHDQSFYGSGWIARKGAEWTASRACKQQSLGQHTRVKGSLLRPDIPKSDTRDRVGERELGKRDVFRRGVEGQSREPVR